MTDNAHKKVRIFDDSEIAIQIFGAQNIHLKLLEDELAVTINNRGNQVEISGDKEAVELADSVLNEVEQLSERGNKIKRTDILSAVRMAQQGKLSQFIKMYEEEIGKDRDGRPIRIKNVGQRNYVHSVKNNDIVLGIGPAGTGKTYVAVAMAVAAMRRGEVKRIILTRPAVEAGEKLGFLPGDLKEKVDPYLRPLYDALYNIYGTEHTNRLMDREIIEVAPLAYMRGRTLDDAFVILDEAQNTTVPQMKMFLTRLGFGSKMIINGDKTQIDLPSGTTSGLIHAERVLSGVTGIGHIHFEAEDVIRHPLVAKVIKAYEKETDLKK
ncbi:PhoH family protein [Marinilactibacillus sp. Marseille-P9653]|uniref:PhoH family protein n=1 Tax=Marinilactibacillus sp. Marseille-P9653 TaxID=2866583 RepID=UPI001CE42206|nr:PhoH family protein [Marinilactibacillus sp. Marseille-P9653]